MNEADGAIAAMAEQQFGVFSRKPGRGGGAVRGGDDPPSHDRSLGGGVPGGVPTAGRDADRAPAGDGCGLVGGHESAISHTTAGAVVASRRASDPTSCT